jgi:hypothetical protein
MPRRNGEVLGVEEGAAGVDLDLRQLDDRGEPADAVGDRQQVGQYGASLDLHGLSL